MAKFFTVEVQQLIPEWRHVPIEADTVEQAIEKALTCDFGEHMAELDYDTARPTTVSQVWTGDKAYPAPENSGRQQPIPDAHKITDYLLTERERQILTAVIDNELPRQHLSAGSEEGRKIVAELEALKSKLRG